ncbi:MAG: CARDB domain-containing protein, partial [Candidatus Bathyarchaeales archaeon]
VTVQNRGGYAESFNVTVYANSAVVGVQSVSLDANSTVVLHFSWNTSGLGKGDYTISALASVVSNEANTADNSFVAAEPVTILFQGHDVAVIGVFPSKTVVGEGYPMNITVKVKDYGTFSEAFNVTVYANTTTLETREISLTSGASATLTFTWNTSGFTKGSYTIYAHAWPVQGETNTTDNVLFDGWVFMSLAGDITGYSSNLWDFIPDGTVDGKDISILSRCFGLTPYKPDWSPNADINNDLFVDGKDISIASRNYGKSW